MQNEITTPDVLLDERGNLKRRGFARRPLLQYNPEKIGVSRLSLVNRLRLKEWDFYGITAPDWYLGTAVSHAGYTGVVFVYFLDFRQQTAADGLAVTPFGRGCRLPRSSETGDVFFRSRGVQVSYRHAPGRRLLDMSWAKLTTGEPLRVEVTLRQPDDLESIVMATPIGRKGFYHNEKIAGLEVEGELRLGPRTIAVKPGGAWGTMDWGRGVWAYRTFWNWASAAGVLPDGRRLGLNLGCGFGDLSAATENCFFLNGRLHKLGWVDIAYNPGDYRRPWRFTDDAGRLDLTLEPFYDRPNHFELGVIGTHSHQMLGRYSGTLIADDGEIIAVRDLFGWAEENRARW